MKKIVTLITGFAIIMSLCCASFAVNQPDDAKTDSEVALSQNVDLSGMDVGDTIYVGNIAIYRAPDDETPPPMTRSTKDGYYASYSGQQTDREYLDLNSTYKYFYIWIKNTSNATTKWMITIGNTEKDQENNLYSYGKGTYYVWSTNAWKAEETLVGYTCGTGLFGETASRLCSTLQEAIDHGK